MIGAHRVDTIGDRLDSQAKNKQLNTCHMAWQARVADSCLPLLEKHELPGLHELRGNAPETAVHKNVKVRPEISGLFDDVNMSDVRSLETTFEEDSAMSEEQFSPRSSTPRQAPALVNEDPRFHASQTRARGHSC